MTRSSAVRSRVLLRGAAWLSVVVIAYLSLIPHSMEVRTPLPPGIEHAVAYAGSAALLTLAYPTRTAWMIAAWLFAYSGVLELLQSLSPGRHPGLAGALWSGAGAALGAFLVQAVRELRPAAKS